MTINTKPVKQKKDIKSKTNNKSKVIIHRVKSEPKLQEKTVTSNGTVLPDMDYDGLKKVIVNVAGGGGEFNPENLLMHEFKDTYNQPSYFMTDKEVLTDGLTGVFFTMSGLAPYWNPKFRLAKIVVNDGEITVEPLNPSIEFYNTPHTYTNEKGPIEVLPD